MVRAIGQTRKHVNPDHKVAILRRYLVEKTPISDLCDEYGIQPSQVYQWQKVLLENGVGSSFCPPARNSFPLLLAKHATAP